VHGTTDLLKSQCYEARRRCTSSRQPLKIDNNDKLTPRAARLVVSHWVAFIRLNDKELRNSILDMDDAMARKVVPYLIWRAANANP
jgi:hypothetical protein